MSKQLHFHRWCPKSVKIWRINDGWLFLERLLILKLPDVKKGIENDTYKMNLNHILLCLRQQDIDIFGLTECKKCFRKS